MSDPAHARHVAAELRLGVGLLVRRLRQSATGVGELSAPEASVLATLERDGPASAAALAKRERISPQSIAHTVAGLTRRGLVQRAADPGDGRRILLSVTPAGASVLHERRGERLLRLASVLEAELSDAELSALADALALIARVADAV